jgi:lipopolysaccharide assembly outer membrane protein LptD (OstA)
MKIILKKIQEVKTVLFISCLISSSLFSNAFVNHSKINADLNHIAKLKKDSITWSASNSAKLSKDKSIITLNGYAKFKCKSFSIEADEIIYNKKSEKIFAKNYSMKIAGIDSLRKGSYGEFSVK